jgi:hypothetical protein
VVYVRAEKRVGLENEYEEGEIPFDLFALWPSGTCDPIPSPEHLSDGDSQENPHRIDVRDSDNAFEIKAVLLRLLSATLFLAIDIIDCFVSLHVVSLASS